MEVGHRSTAKTPGYPAGVTARIDDLIEATPASRDRYVDFLRAASILVVVVGHWTIAVIAWKNGVIRSTSAVGKAPGLWLATWLFQVMPVFFYLWHMTAYLAAILLLWPLGFGRETEPSARWWIERPLWLVIPGVLLAGLVALFGRFEAQGRR